MYCTRCGKEIRSDQKFCGNCGAKNVNYQEKNDLKEMIEKAAAGEENALEKIYNLTYVQGFAIALQMVKNEQDAMDIMQDAYISAFRNLKQIEDPKRLKSWFNCIVVNKCKDWLKKKKPQLFSDIPTGDDDREFEDTIADENLTFSPEESVDYAETKRLMKEILDGLPEDQKLCVLMYYYEELSVSDIADALGCSTGTVKSRLNYARKKIRNDVGELERKGTKLYSVAPLPFILWMLREGEQTISVPGSFGKELVNGDSVFDFDITKLSVHTLDIGLAGIEVYDILRDEYDIQIEFGDIGNILAYLSIGDRAQEVERLVSALAEIRRRFQKDKSGLLDLEYIDLQVVTSPQEAFYAEKCSLPLRETEGKVCSEFVMCYPPGIPILAPGELITPEILEYIHYAKDKGCSMTGPEDMEIKRLNVIKE